MDTRYVPLIIGWFIFLGSEIIAYMIFTKMKKYKFFKYPNIKTIWWTPHTLINALSLIILCGHGMVIFRLVPGVRTRYLKFIHFGIHTYVACMSYWSYGFIGDFMKYFSLKPRDISSIHSKFGKIVLYIYGAQYIVSLFIFLYMYSDQLRRKMFSAIHNFLGICILQLNIINACIIMESNYHGGKELSNVKVNDQTAHMVVLFITYGLLINAIVLNPYLEWPLIGPI